MTCTVDRCVTGQIFGTHNDVIGSGRSRKCVEPRYGQGPSAGIAIQLQARFCHAVCFANIDCDTGFSAVSHVIDKHHQTGGVDGVIGT